MLTELGERINKHSKNFNKDLENVKKNQWELNIEAELNWNTLEGINRRLGDTEEHISDLEDRIMETRIAERNKQTEKNGKSLRDPWKHIKHINISMGPRRRKERQNGVENLFDDIRTENFPSLRKETDVQI